MIKNRFSTNRPPVKTIEGATMAQQQFKDESDINTLVKKYLLKGVTPPGARIKPPQYADFTSIDFQEMQNTIADVQFNFQSLPARLRSKFQNSPYQLLRWLENPANEAEAVKYGLIDKEEMTPEGIKAAADAQKAAEDAYNAANGVEQTDLVKQAAKAATGGAARPPES